MILSYNWLTELIDLPVSPDELPEVLTHLGLEVEKTVHYRPRLDKVVIGVVLECAPVSGSDHLVLTRIGLGSESIPVVCGAPNVRSGMVVAVMLPGAQTADGHTIKKTRLKGCDSLGMLASEHELGLSDDHTGIIEGDDSWKPGSDAAVYLQFADTIFDVETTPNRPDYLSHIGVARDLGARFRLPWRWPDHPLVEGTEPASNFIRVEIAAPDGCPRYAARIIHGVRVVPSPYAIRIRLQRCGIRPISNLVDVTNYLMLEYGQPLHAFDLRFIEGRQIVVRYAAEKEHFVTLDSQEHELSSRDLLIADAVKGVALAGVMGGLNSEIRDDTSDVLIECAYFDPVHIRRTAKAYGLGSESSRRFERGVDPNGIPRVINATAAMMSQLGGGEVSNGIVDAYAKPIHPVQISFRPSRCDSLIGLSIPHEEMTETLQRLGCNVETSKETWNIVAPTWRPDLEREIDLIEEIIRVHGYEDVPVAKVSRVPLSGSDNPLVVLHSKVVDSMVSLGFHETLTVSMYTPDPRRDPPNMPPGVAVANPVTDDMKFMHGSLLPGLIRAATANWQRGDRNLRLFEVARVFHEGGPRDPRTWERKVLAAVMTGQSYPQSWNHPAKPFDVYDLKGVIEVLSVKISLDKVEINCYDIESGEVLEGEIRSNDTTVGHWGIWPADVMSKRDIDATVGWFELDLGTVSEYLAQEFKLEPLPRFPVAWRDLALVVDERVTAGDLVKTIWENSGWYLVRCEPFDLFRSDKLGTGKKSLAFRLEFSHPSRSLETDEIDKWISNIVQGLKDTHGAVLR